MRILVIIPNSYQNAPFKSKYFFAWRFAKILASVRTVEFFKEAKWEKIKIEWRILVINWYKGTKMRTAFKGANL